MGKVLDITGKKYNKLTIIKMEEIKNHKTRWLCKCDCGNYIVACASDIKLNKTKSCGCLKKEIVSKLGKKDSCSTHKKYNTRIYRIWIGIKQRCNNKNNYAYKYYGKRGIKVCNEWLHDFMNFYNWAMSNGYKDNLTIDRIDVNGNYEPSNCRWVNNLQQQNNKRNNKIITYENKKYTMAELSRKLNIKYDKIKYMVKTNWSEENLNKKIEKGNRINE